MIRILGIDPGSVVTGYGLIDSDGIRHRYCDSGSIRLPATGFPERLRMIFESLGEIIDRWAPTEVAVEQVFVNRYPGSALKLGQARGAAICAVVTRHLPVAEYTPREVKLAVVGTGGADKAQVQHMVKVLLSLERAPSVDAADALGVALCHGNTRQGLRRMGLAAGAEDRREA
jgi:crossover junction endodeoxyribonuclease RuvC